MRNYDDVRRALDAHPRPRVGGATFAAWSASIAEARRWDMLHPRDAAEYAALLEELEDARAREAAERKASVQALRAESWARHVEAELPERLLAAAHAPTSTQALEAARVWWAGGAFGQGFLLLTGDVGTGKSVAAAWVVREALLAGRSACWDTAARVARLGNYGDDGARFARLCRADVVAIDDVGTETGGPRAAAMLFELLDARHADRRRTVLTTNLEPRVLAERMGTRLADRVRESLEVVRCVGPSLRKAGGQ